VIKSCIECGQEFNAARQDARFCSSACKQRSHRRPVTDSPPVTAPVTDKPRDQRSIDQDRGRKMRLEADKLYRLQVKERGIIPHPTKKGLTIPGPYVSTPEREQRAQQIISLRRYAALLEYPL
jgi:hypothetical protein